MNSPIHKKTIKVLIGIPASGKSTYAREEVRQGNGAVIRINKDDIRKMVHDNKFSREREKMTLSVRDNMIAVAMTNDNIKTIIVDDTNLVSKHYINIEREWGAIANVERVWFDDSFNVDLCHKRNQQRTRTVPHRVIESMYENFVKIDLEIRQNKSWPLHNESGEEIIICDIDGTIADHDGIRSPFDWSKVGFDRPKTHIIEIVNMYNEMGYPIFMLSGRDSVCRRETELWLEEHGVKYNQLLMRPHKDSRKDYIIKQELYEQFILPKYNVKMIFDDRNQIVRLWRSLGLNCIQVSNGDF